MASRIFSQYCAQFAIAACSLACSSSYAFLTPEYIPDRSVAAMHGPFQFIIEDSDKTGWFFDPKYVNDICEFDALAVEVGFGSQIFRASTTWGHAFTNDLFMKVTGEYLGQDPNFGFSSGVIDRWFGQWALGVDLAAFHMFACPGIHRVHFAVEYYDSQTENLPNALNADGSINIRRVAGTQAMGVDFGVRIQPWLTGYADLELYYDSQNFYRVLETPDGNSGFGVGAAIYQYVNDCVLFSAGGLTRRPFYEYYLQAKWIPSSSIGTLLEFSLQFTNAGGPATAFGKENRLAFGFAYSWGGDCYGTPRNYQDPLNRGLRQDLLDYTNVPVVRPPQVMEKIDQTSI